MGSPDRGSPSRRGAARESPRSFSGSVSAPDCWSTVCDASETRGRALSAESRVFGAAAPSYLHGKANALPALVVVLHADHFDPHGLPWVQNSLDGLHLRRER